MWLACVYDNHIRHICIYDPDVQVSTCIDYKYCSSVALILVGSAKFNLELTDVDPTKTLWGHDLSLLAHNVHALSSNLVPRSPSFSTYVHESVCNIEKLGIGPGAKAT